MKSIIFTPKSLLRQVILMTRAPDLHDICVALVLETPVPLCFPFLMSLALLRSVSLSMAPAIVKVPLNLSWNTKAKDLIQRHLARWDIDIEIKGGAVVI